MQVLVKSAHLRRAPAGGIAHYKGGQFISADIWEGERTKAKDALPALLDGFGERLQFLRSLYDQNAQLEREGLTKVSLVPLSTMEAQMKTAIRETYARAFLLGKRSAGDLTSATDEQQEAVKRLRIDEYKYLRNFLADMRQGAGVMDYAARADYYRAAARELFWLGFVLGNQKAGRFISWVYDPAKESCETCLGFGNHGRYPVAEFVRDVLGQGYLPQSGKLACLGYRCGCRLEESFEEVAA